MPRSTVAVVLAVLVVAASVCGWAAAQDACTVCSCTPAGGTVTAVNCDGLALTAIPTNIPVTTVQLILRSNKLSILTAQSFNSLASLEQLDLSSNNINSIEAGAFTGLGSLTTLVLTDNNVASLLDSTFASTPSLTSLFLKNNGLTQLSATVFQPTPLLTHLDLSGNSLGDSAALPATLFAPLVDLETLDLSNNRISTLAASQFSTLGSLTTLHLEQNPPLTVIPPALFHSNPNLQLLSLKSCGLSSIAANQFQGLGSLTTLFLEDNVITSLPSGVFPAGLSSLETLHLATNAITSVSPSDFSSLPSLAQLTLGENPLNCCGLEWLRDSFAELQDKNLVACDRPELVSGELLQDTAGTVGLCSQDAPGQPSPPVQVMPYSDTALTVQWDNTDGYAYAIDSFKLEYILTSDIGSGSWTTVTCPDGQYPTDLTSNPASACSFLVTYEGTAVDPLTFTQTGLLPYTMYSFRVTAHSPLNGGTFGTASAASSPMRTEQAAPSQPDPVTISDVTARSLTVSWTEPSPANGVVQEYTVRLLKDGSVVQTATVNGTTFSHVFTVLPFTNYTATVQATTVAAGPQSTAPAQIATDEDAPGSAGGPVMLSSDPYARAGTELKLQWAAVPLAQRNGIITNYTLHRRVGAGAEVLACHGVALECTADGLTPATTYTWILRAYTAAGSATASPVDIFTAEAAPSAPGQPSVTAVSATELSLSWSTPAQPNGVIIKYEVFGGKQGTTFAKLYETSGAVVTTTVISGLQPNQQYGFEVRAFTNPSEPGQFSTTGFGTTNEAAPSALVNVTASPVSATSVLISWQPPVTPNGAVTGYKVYQVNKVQSLTGFPTVQDGTDLLLYNASASELSFTHSNLDPATTYSYNVFALTSAGMSGASNTASALTLEAAPSRPDQIPTIVAVTSDSVTISWTKPKVPNGQITKYGVRVWKSSSQFVGVEPSVETAPDVLTATITGLDSNTLYSFSVVAYTNAEGEQSFTVQQRTKSDDFDYKQTVIIVITVTFVVLLAIGYTYEKRKSSGAHKISPSPSTAQLVSVTSVGSSGMAPRAQPRPIGVVGAAGAGVQKSGGNNADESSGSSDEDEAPATTAAKARTLPPVRAPAQGATPTRTQFGPRTTTGPAAGAAGAGRTPQQGPSAASPANSGPGAAATPARRQPVRRLPQVVQEESEDSDV